MSVTITLNKEHATTNAITPKKRCVSIKTSILTLEKELSIIAPEKEPMLSTPKKHPAPSTPEKEYLNTINIMSNEEYFVVTLQH